MNVKVLFDKQRNKVILIICIIVVLAISIIGTFSIKNTKQETGNVSDMESKVVQEIETSIENGEVTELSAEKQQEIWNVVQNTLQEFGNLEEQTKEKFYSMLLENLSKLGYLSEKERIYLAGRFEELLGNEFFLEFEEVNKEIVEIKKNMSSIHETLSENVTSNMDEVNTVLNQLSNSINSMELLLKNEQMKNEVTNMELGQKLEDTNSTIISVQKNIDSLQLYVDESKYQMDQKYTTRVEQIQTRIQEIKKEIDYINDNIHMISEQVKALKIQDEMFEKELKEIAEDIKTSGVAISTLEKDLNLLEEEVQNNKLEITQSLNALEKATADKFNTISDKMDTEINGLDTRTSKNETTIFQILGSVGENSTQIQEHSEQISNISETIGDLSKEDQSLVSDLLTKQEQLSNHEEAITYIKDKLIASDATMNEVNAVIEYLKSASTQTTSDIALAGERMTGIEQSVAECFQSVSSGKSILASAITDKGVPADATASFSDLAAKILLIPNNTTPANNPAYEIIEYRHQHVGSSSESGGCYTVPIYHVHTGSSSSGGGCYTVRNEQINQVRCGGSISKVSWASCRCNKCGKYFINSVEGGYDTWPMPSSCDEIVGTNVSYFYTLGCGKNESVVEGYATGCGYEENELTGYDLRFIE